MLPANSLNKPSPRMKYRRVTSAGGTIGSHHPMKGAHKTRGPRLLVLLGFGSAAVGAMLLSLATFQTQTQTSSGSTLGPAPITLTFTHQSLDPGIAALLVVIMAIPVWSGYLRWDFYLTSLGAPVLVALGIGVWIYQNQLASSAGSIVLSSAFGVFLGDALVFLGCALEITGVVLTRFRRRDALGGRSPGTATPRLSLSPPR